MKSNSLITDLKYQLLKPKLKCLVLNYHGIIEQNTAGHLERNFYLLKSFKEQVKLFHKRYNMISVQELYYSLFNGHKITSSVVFTFDDGYQNNQVDTQIISSINPYSNKIGFSVLIIDWFISELKIELESVANNVIYGIRICAFNKDILKKDSKDFIDGNSLIDSINGNFMLGKSVLKNII